MRFTLPGRRAVITPDEIRNKLEGHKETLREFKVESLSVFGSVARGEAGINSDIDLLVEFSEPVGLFAFVRLQRFLEEVLHSRVDLTTPAALRDSMRDHILQEAVRAA
jgi:predicted nucleotidyltransferase